MSGTLIFDAYEAWLNLATLALPDVLVLDGPQPSYTSETDLFLVGVDDPASDRPRSIDNDVQDWESLGAYSRMETYTIFSSFAVWTGDNDFSACRSTVKGYVAALTNALYPPPHGVGDAMLNNTLNKGVGAVGWCGLTSVGPVNQIQFAGGTALHVVISLGCVNRI